MNSKQEIALRTIAQWADRFGCIKGVVIFGSVARGDEEPNSDLDVDLEFVVPLTEGAAESYRNACRSFDHLRRDILRATGHSLDISNYASIIWMMLRDVRSNAGSSSVL